MLVFDGGTEFPTKESKVTAPTEMRDYVMLAEQG